MCESKSEEHKDNMFETSKDIPAIKQTKAKNKFVKELI